MDLKSLQIFRTVYDERSFSKAAKVHRVSQSTISAHIKSLETALSASLFDRLGTRISPTQAGELLYLHGGRILSEQSALFTRMERLLGRLDGELGLAASTIPGEYLVPRLLASFHEQHPGVRIEVPISDSSVVAQQVEQGRAEIGLAGGKTTSKDLQYESFAKDQVVLIAAPDPRWSATTKLSLAELRREPIVSRERGSGSRMAVERAFDQSRGDLGGLRTVAELGSTTALKEAVKSRLGLAFVSARSIETEVKAGWLRVLDLPEIPTIEREFWIVSHRRRSLSPAAETFLAHLRASAA